MLGNEVHEKMINPQPFGWGFLYKENHSLYEWFKKAYGGEKKTLLR